MILGAGAMDEILLLRHGEALRGSPDFERELSDRGKRDAQRAGNWLLENDLVPDLVLSSTAVRAATSAERCIKAAGRDTSVISLVDDIYNASVTDLMGVIDGIDRGGRVMIVGHNPGLAELVGYLTGGRTGISMDPASMAHLLIPDDGPGRLLQVVSPDELPAGFIFPGTPDAPRRDRPAYYYTQSGVIPYRIVNGATEVLLVTTRGSGWAVPKGIVEPGLSPIESAAREAREEAGAEGEIDSVLLGAFDFTKWGARCRVSVFPMKVSGLLDGRDWAERNRRKRKWFSPEDAMARVKFPEVAEMIHALSRTPSQRQR
jgi:phosphohistidine phosphatase